MGSTQPIVFNLTNLPLDQVPDFIVCDKTSQGEFQVEDRNCDSLLKWFSNSLKNSQDAQIVFSTDLHRSHRAYFHKLIQRNYKNSLEAVSRGIGNDRRLYIGKKGGFVVPYNELDESQKQKVGQLFRWVKQTELQYSRDEIAECVLSNQLPEDLQILWENKQKLQDKVRELISLTQKGCLQSVQTLFKEEPYLTDNDFIELVSGQTPLHVASQLGQLDTIRCFVENGIDVDILNDEEKTPLEMAKFAEQCDAEGLLLQVVINYQKKVSRKLI
eukprot:TRINITY_DN11343_c0_g1_i3.p1 TRINITY_DN11343_c0_g1~~TRINITY_DN11343_c0_g1_i3.p1  ORF type:complete len:272 (+),score=30.63 TRINITY_DN11343_c0_g1_i3:183-998(+)